MATPDDVKEMLSMLAATQPRYNRAETYYTGTQPEVFSSTQIKNRLSKQGKNYRFNFLSAAVDAILERLEIAGIICSDETARDLLNDVWAENEMDIYSKFSHKSALKFGDSYLIAMPDDDPAFPSGVSIYSHVPSDVFVEYDPSRPRFKSRAVHSVLVAPNETNGLAGARSDRYHSVTMYYPDRIVQYYSSKPIDKNGFDYTRSDLRFAYDFAPPVPGVIPVFHLQTGRPYGESVMARGYAVQDAITKTIISLMSAVDYAAFPQRYALTDKGERGGGDLLNGDSAPDDSEGELNPADFESHPGATWLLSGNNVRVGEFQAAQSANFLAPIDAQLGYLSRITSVPTHYFTSSSTPLSGYAYRQAERPLTKKVESIQQLFESTYGELFDYVLALKGYAPRAVEANVAWHPSDMVDVEILEGALLKRQLGVPDPVLLVESGYSQEDIDNWRVDPKYQAPTAREKVEPVAETTPDDTVQ